MNIQSRKVLTTKSFFLDLVQMNLVSIDEQCNIFKTLFFPDSSFVKLENLPTLCTPRRWYKHLDWALKRGRLDETLVIC